MYRCRLGIGSVFYHLGLFYLQRGFQQRAHNLNQLAMSMLWDTTRLPGGMDCLQEPAFGVSWMEDFMNTYLTLAMQLQRHTVEGQPRTVTVPKTFRGPLRIAVMTVCDYSADHQLYQIDALSFANRVPYTELHGYANRFYNKRQSGRHPVWDAIYLPLQLLKTGEYDWVLSIDCDCMFVDMETTIDSLIYRQAGIQAPDGSVQLDESVHFLISEDGRGLAGGNWLVRNSPWAIAFLERVYGPDDDTNPFLLHDLRDQFSFLWHLVRPKALDPTPPAVGPLRWENFEYIEEVRLVPQKWLNSYPWAFCRPSHHCFEDGEDFIVSFITLGSLSRDMAFALLRKFLYQSFENYAALTGNTTLLETMCDIAAPGC